MKIDLDSSYFQSDILPERLDLEAIDRAALPNENDPSPPLHRVLLVWLVLGLTAVVAAWIITGGFVSGLAALAVLIGTGLGLLAMFLPLILLLGVLCSL